MLPDNVLMFLEYDTPTQMKMTYTNLSLIFFNDGLIEEVEKKRIGREISIDVADNIIRRHIKLVYNLPMYYYDKNKYKLRKGGIKL